MNLPTLAALALGAAPVLAEAFPLPFVYDCESAGSLVQGCSARAPRMPSFGPWVNTRNAGNAPRSDYTENFDVSGITEVYDFNGEQWRVGRFSDPRFPEFEGYVGWTYYYWGWADNVWLEAGEVHLVNAADPSRRGVWWTQSWSTFMAYEVGRYPPQCYSQTPLPPGSDCEAAIDTWFGSTFPGGGSGFLELVESSVPTDPVPLPAAWLLLVSSTAALSFTARAPNR